MSEAPGSRPVESELCARRNSGAPVSPDIALATAAREQRKHQRHGRPPDEPRVTTRNSTSQAGQHRRAGRSRLSPALQILRIQRGRLAAYEGQAGRIRTRTHALPAAQCSRLVPPAKNNLQYGVAFALALCGYAVAVLLDVGTGAFPHLFLRGIERVSSPFPCGCNVS